MVSVGLRAGRCCQRDGRSGEGLLAGADEQG